MAYVPASQSGYGSGPSVIHIDASHPDVVSISDAELLFTGHLERKGPDLLLTGHDGHHHIIPGYFSAEHNADLVAPNGARITGDLVDLLAGSAAPGQYAQTQSTVPTDAIGRIEKVVGDVTVIRNGVAVALHVGDAVYKNDVVQTGADSSAGIGFADGTALNLVANTRMALNDYVYDPNGSSNVALFNLVQGGFAFVAGKVAHTGDMKIGTPVATMGIRGTTGYALEQVATVNANAGNVTMSFAVVADPGSDRVGQYELIDQFGNVVAQIGRAGIWTNVQFQGANLSPNISYTQMTASNFAVEQALVPALVQILNSINTQNLNPTPQSGPNSPGSSTPPIFELINLPQSLQQNSGTSLPISVPVNGANGSTTASGTVSINATPGPQATATVTWSSSSNGTWRTATNWSDLSPPEAAQFVNITRAVKVTIDAAEAVSGLLIGTGATLNIISGGALELLSGIANFGTLQINSSGSDPTLAINGTVYLLNSGTIALIGPTNENLIVGVGGTGATLVNVNNTIIGSGTIGQGDGALTLVNGSRGTIEATPLVAGDSGLLIVNTGNAVNNSGLMTAAAGGTLHIFDSVTNLGLIKATASGTIIAAGSIDNYNEIEASGSGAQVSLTGLTNESGATIIALSGGTITLADIITNFGTIGANGAGAIVDLEGAHVSGGTLETRSSGIIEILSGTSIFSDVTLAHGSFVTDADTVLRLEGSTALGGTVRFEGTGTVKLEGASAEITGESNTHVGLDNFSTISGEGKIGAGDRHFLLDNQDSGVIDASGQRALILDNDSPGSAGSQPGNAVINTGLIEASGVGGLTIENTTISNAADAAHDTGHIRVFGGSQITLDSATILHGFVSIDAGGEMLTAKGTSDTIETADGQDNLSTVTLSNHGTLLVSDNSSLTLASPDAIDNSGTIKLDSTGRATDLYFDQQDAGIKGDGQIVLSDNPDNVIRVTQSGDQLTNFGNTISGAGTIGTGGMVMVNGGVIDADHHNAELTLDPAFLANTGTLEATNRATLVISDTTVSNSSATTATGATYSFNTLADPAAQGSGTPATGINDAGQVVGTYYADETSYGFVYSNGSYTTLDDPAGVYGTVANGINDAEQIVGYYYDANGAHGFLDSNGKYTTLNDPSAVNGTYANAINDSGQIVGYYYGVNNNVQGFLDSNGIYIPLSDPLGANGTVASGINNAGQIVGYYLDASFRVHGFLDSNGVYITLNDPPAGTGAFQGTFAEGINTYGQIVGYYIDSNGVAHGFLYSNGTYTPLDDTSGVNGTLAYGINNVGQVAGSYFDDSFSQNGFVADPNGSPSFGNVTANRGTTIDLASSTIIDGTVDIRGVLDSIGTSIIVDAAINNTGTIKSTGGGTLTINSGTLDNADTLKVTHGSTLDVSADVTGDGTVIIKNGGQADFTGAFIENVTFSGAGTLALARSYGGTVSEFGKGDKIDLTTLAYSRREYAIWTQTTTANGGSGTLNVYAGAALAASILMNGDYAANSFAVVDDSSGHAEVVAATTDRWTEVTHSGRWNNASNWNNGNGGVPTSTTNTLIDKSGTYGVVISGAAHANSVKIGNADATLDGSGVLTTVTLDNHGRVAAGAEQSFTINEIGNGQNFGTIGAFNGGDLTINHFGTATNERHAVIEAVGDGSTLTLHIEGGGANYGLIKAADGGALSLNIAETQHGDEGGNHNRMEAVSGGAFTVIGGMTNWSGATVTADGPGSAFDFRSGDYPTGITNQWEITAANDGIVRFSDVFVDNYGGTIAADGTDAGNSARVNLTNTEIAGGTLRTDSGGVINIVSPQDDGSNKTYFVGTAYDGVAYGALTVDADVQVHSGATLQLFGTIDFQSGRIDNAGTIDGNGLLDSGDRHFKLLNRADATIDANVSGQTLTIDAGRPIINNGTLEATKGGALIVDDAVKGSGTDTIGHHAILDFQSAVSRDQTVTFSGRTGTLALSDPEDFHGHITGLIKGDTIDLTTIDQSDITSAKIHHGEDATWLVVDETDGPRLKFNISGDLTDSQFNVVSNHHGGTDLVLAEASPPPPPTDTWTDGNSDGQWSEGGNWSAGLPAPNEDVIVGSGSSPTINSSFVVLDADAVQDTGTIIVASGSTLTLEDGTSITGDGTGTLTIGSQYSAGALDVEAGVNGGATLDGVAVSDNGALDIGEVNSGAILTLDDGTTITGNGIGTLTINANNTLDIETGANGPGATLDGVNVTNHGTLEVGETTAAVLTFEGDTTINGGSLVDDGSIVANGSVDIGSTVTGTGSFTIESGSTLKFDTSVAVNLTVSFADSTGTLALSDPADFHANISGLAVGDTIDLTNLGYTSSEYDVWTQTSTVDGGDGTLAIYSGAGGLEETLHLNGIYTQNEFALASDGSSANGGSGGTDVNFNYVSFCNRQINTNGNVAPQISDHGSTLTLTDGGLSEASSWFANAKISVGNFTASFDYQATPYGGGLADGLAFILQDSSARTSALGGDGSSLGYGDVAGTGGTVIATSAAVEFNVYSGHTQGTNFATNGSTETYNSTSPVDFWDTGDTIQVVLSYNGSTLVETLTDLVNGNTYSTSYDNVNLSQILGSDAAYVGFSAATGGGVSTQTVSNFTFDAGTSSYSAVNDFSITNGNPNSVWSYLAGGTLLGTTESEVNGLSGLVRWYNGQTQVPDIAAVIKNTTASTIALGGSDQIPPEHLNLDPQGISNVAVQFTAPASGTYVITGNFLGDDTGEQAHSVQVLDDGTAVFAGTISSFGEVAAFSLVETLSAGDTIDFAVDTGNNGVYYNLSTGLAATVSSAVAIATGATLNLGASTDTIAFAGSTGTLTLEQPSNFNGQIAGISGNEDVIDLKGFEAADTTATTGSGSYNSVTDLTTLTVYDASDNATVTLSLVGDYSHSTWTSSSDGHGGADIVDPPAKPSGASVSPDNDTFVFHPGMGPETASNFNAHADTIELDNFNNIHSVHQLAALITTDAQGDAVIGLGHHDSITLPGVSANYLQAHLHSLVHLG